MVKPTTLKQLLNIGRKQAAKVFSVVGHILTRGYSRIDELAKDITLAISQICDFAFKASNRLRQFTIRLFRTIANLLFLLWTIWTRELATRVVFYLAGILLITLFTVVVIGVVDFYLSVPNDTIPTAIEQIYQRGSFLVLVIIAMGLVLLWGLLGYIARETLVVLSFTRIWGTKLLDYIIRLLGSLPTLILGNAVLVLFSATGIHPQGFIANLVFVISALALIGLPTVLQIGQEVLKDYDKKQVYQAAALGLNGIVIGKKIVMPSIKRSFDAAVTLAVSRIIIEGYIVLNQVFLSLPTSTRMLRDPQDLLDIFSSVYSTMSIQSNVGLISLLFIIAVLVNVWSFSITTLQKP